MGNSRNDRIDRLYRYAMLVTGILAAVLFLGSLVAMVEFPGAFSSLAIGMVATAVVFFVLRTIYHFRDTFRVKR
jgi:putative flippase GtrA